MAYILNYLEQFQRNLFYKARMFAKELSYKFMWLKNNKNLYKKKMKTPMQSIKIMKTF